MEILLSIVGFAVGYIGTMFLIMLIMIPCEFFLGNKAFSFTIQCPNCRTKGPVEMESVPPEKRIEKITQAMEGVKTGEPITDKFLWLGKDKWSFQHFLCPYCGADIKEGPLFFMNFLCKLIAGFLLLLAIYWLMSNYTPFGLGFLIGAILSGWQLGV